MNDKTILLLGALFYAVANPMTYEIVDKLVPVVDSNGPTYLGVLFHALVFCVLLTLMTKFKMVNKVLA